MSYDISLHITVDTGGPQPVELELADVGNYTSNAARMWGEALGHSLSELTGKTAGDCLAALTTAVTAMTADPAKFKALEPANGWGDYHGALAYLSRLRDACAEHPKAEICISH